MDMNTWSCCNRLWRRMCKTTIWPRRHTHHTKKKKKSRHKDDVGGDGIGTNVPLTEKGYQLVADLKDDDEMRAFIQRVIRQDARYVNDIAQLSGVVPFYSGEQHVQSLAALREEIRRAPWVGETEGRVAALNEVGYQKVIDVKHKPDMMAFARRILDVFKKRCTDEDAFVGFVSSFFDGENAHRDFATLKKELLAAPWLESRGTQLLSLQDGE